MHVMGGIGWPAGLLRESPPAFESAQELAADVGAGASSYTDYDRAITEAACDWLLTRGEADNPWAAFFSLVSPHYPLIAPQEFYDLYDRASVDLPIAYEHAQRPRHSELMNLARFFDYDRHFDDRKLREAKVAYYGLISFMDDCIGRILSALTRSGQTDDTVVIYVSDHGDMMGDHGFWTKHVMYEASAGIPMIAAGPDVAEGRRVQTGTSLVDLAATAVDVTGLCDHGAAELFPGRSLRSIAGEEDDRNRTIFSEYHDGGSTTGAFMVRWEDWKFVYYVGHDPQLFNLAQDPHELFNLAYEGVNDPVVQAAWRDGESRLRAICDPEEVNARCIADQRRKIAELGGVEACKNAYVFKSHTTHPMNSKTVCPSAAVLCTGGSPYTGSVERGLLSEQGLKPGARTMVDCSEVFVGMDVSKDSHAVAVAESGRDGEARFYGEIGSDGASVRRFVRKL